MILNAFVFSLVLSGGWIFAQEDPTELGPVRVFGADEASLLESVTSGKVSKEKIKGQQITDVNRALKQTPGVYVREEDGQGLRPNIGLRGTDPDRSKKVVLLEDGILIGPAPYSAPAAYYTPNMNHVESLEIYKGFSATGIGPNSIGGAVDYRTLTIPSEPSTRLKSSFGSFNTWNNEVSHGSPTQFGGYLLQGSGWSSEGFKKLDGGGNTGFDKKDAIVKLRFDLPGSSDRLHAIEFKLGYADEVSNETYLGLTRSDFNRDFDRRYRASSLDKMQWAHKQVQLHHELQVSRDSLLATDIYHHEFHRSWFRLDRFRDPNVTLKGILTDPDLASNTGYYQVLKGELDSSIMGGTNGQLIIANNDRTYLSRGVQSRWTKIGSESNWFKPWAFARVHEDYIERFHTAHNFEMVSGEMVRTGDAVSVDTANKELTTALTLSAGADFSYNDLVFTPILRYENANFERFDRLSEGNNRERNDNLWVSGISALKKVNNYFSTRISINEAATLAGLDPSGNEVKEEALNKEVELRFVDPENWLDWQLTYFQTDYKNLTGTCTVSAGCNPAQLDTVFNGGKAQVEGVEAGVSKGFALGAFFFPLQANVTLLDAKFKSRFNSTSNTWGVGTVNEGDPLPYIPETQYSITAGVEWRKIKSNFVFTHQSKIFDQSASANREEIEAYGIVDWSAEYQVLKSLQVLAKIDNLLAREYAVGARPFGLRPGKPQSFQVGLSYVF